MPLISFPYPAAADKDLWVETSCKSFSYMDGQNLDNKLVQKSVTTHAYMLC